jgi:hypothetical protein
MLPLALLMGVPNRSGVPGAPTVWTLCDWRESDGIPGRIPVFEEPESNEPMPSPYHASSSTPLGSCTNE